MLCVIPAREGSKRFPKKNVSSFFGVSLIARAIEQAIACNNLQTIVVTSDDEEVIDIASKYDVDVDIRPKRLAEDGTRIIDVCRYLLDKEQYQQFDAICLMFVTSPFRRISDLDKAIGLYNKPEVDSVTTITEYQVSPQLALEASNGFVKPWYSEKYFRVVTSKQKIPKLYYPNYMIQIFSRDVMNKFNGFVGDKCGYLEIEKERAVDIDEYLDFVWAEHLVNSGVGSLD